MDGSCRQRSCQAMAHSSAYLQLLLFLLLLCFLLIIFIVFEKSANIILLINLSVITCKSHTIISLNSYCYCCIIITKDLITCLYKQTKTITKTSPLIMTSSTASINDWLSLKIIITTVHQSPASLFLLVSVNQSASYLLVRSLM